MDKISVKTSDISLRGTESVKSAGQAKEVTGDFKKLLQGQNDNSSKDVPKDTKTEKQPEAVKEQKKEESVKTEDTKKEAGKEETGKEEKIQTDGLLAAYQLAQNFRPEMVQAEPEAVVEEIMPEEIQVVPETEAISELTVQTEEVQAAETIQVQPESLAETGQIQPEKAAADARPQTEQPVQEIHAEKAPEAVSVQQKADTPEQQEDTAQSDSRFAEQQAVQVQNPESSVKVEVQELKPQEPVRVEVPQPEELPEKITDQLMAKISQGVQEFEIHIEPANLGKIAVKILYQAGQATVSIMCSEKHTLDILGRNAGEIGQIIDKNLGGTTTIVVDKQESDYLNQTRDENQQNGQNGGQEQQKGGKKEQSGDNAQDFLQKLRLGLTS